MFRQGLLLGLLSVALSCPARAADAPDAAAPILRIETGMHGAAINRLAVDEAAGRIVTVSDDKTTRQWSLADGSSQHVWRTPIGDGDKGQMLAVALSGDTMVAGGGDTTDAGTVYLFNLKTGALRGAAPPDKWPISALAFSRDGNLLAVGHQGDGGVRLVDFSTLKNKARDASYKSTVRWLAFGPDATLAVTSDDGDIRLLDGDLKEVARAKLPTAGDKPWGVAFSPDGGELAVGDRNRADVAIYSTHGMKLLQTLHGAPQTAGDLGVVAWSADGKLLAAAGSYRGKDETRLIRFWQVAGDKFTAMTDVPVATDTVTDLSILSTGETIYASADPSFGVVGKDGVERLHHKSHDPDFRDGRDAFKLSSDGAILDFPTTKGGKGVFRFDLLEGTLTKDPPAAETKAATIDDPKLKVSNWLNSTSVKLGGRAIDLEANEHVHSVAVIPKAGRVALGTDFYLRAEAAEAGKGWQTVVPAPAFVVNATADGRYVVAGLGDGTIRWYASTDGHEVMSLFADPEDSRWVAWLPEGFFDHSDAVGQPGGETLVGYQISHGAGKLGDFVQIGQLYDKFYRKDLVIARFRGEEAQENYVQNQVSRTGDYRSVLKTGLPPTVKLLDFCVVDKGATGCPDGTGKAPETGDQKHFDLTGTGDSLFARFQVTDRGGGLGPVVVRRNDATIEGTRKVESEDAKQRTETVVLPLKTEANTVKFSTVSAAGSIESPPEDAVFVTVKPNIAVTPGATTDAEAEATLYALVVGVSKYQEPAFRLDNAANDARALQETLNHDSPPVYTKPKITLLLDENATIPKITDALNDIAAHARPQDIVIIFFSGHGEAVDNKYYYAPFDFATHNPQLVDEAKHSDDSRQEEIVEELFRKEGLGESVLFPIFGKIQGNMLLILDTCYSATITTKDAVAEKAHNDTVTQGIGHDTGRFILAGSRALALDSGGAKGSGDVDQHGLFTFYLLKGLDGAADRAHEGKIAVDDLLKYTRSTVKAESHKIHQDQEPRYQMSGTDMFDVRAVPSK